MAKNISGNNRMGRPRKDNSLGSGQEEKVVKPEKSDIAEDDKTDQKIINEQSDPQGISGAPAIIKERMSSVPPIPPESQDIEYLTQEEYNIGSMINTLDVMLVENPEASESHLGPFIERCVGRDPETGKMRVVRVRAKEVKIAPDQIMQYLGSVVQDHQSVHSPTIMYQRRRWGYTFDRFYMHNNKRIERCCLVLDRGHQAGLMYEKMVDKKSNKAFSRIRQIKGQDGQGTGNPMYKVVGVKEGYYRDLKRLFERHFLKRGDESLADDIGLKMLVGA